MTNLIPFVDYLIILGAGLGAGTITHSLATIVENWWHNHKTQQDQIAEYAKQLVFRCHQLETAKHQWLCRELDLMNENRRLGDRNKILAVAIKEDELMNKQTVVWQRSC